jgi:hypothetical protein
MISANSFNKFTLWFVWALLHPEKKGAFNSWAAKKNYYLRNVEVCKQRAKAYRNSDAGRAYMRQWSNERIQSNLQFKLEKNLRTRMWWALHAKNCQSSNVKELLGCSVGEFKQHIESQFQTGWTWENWGTIWEIDHMRPCSSFDLADPAQRKLCFHFSNQRPLGMFENRSKGAKWNV